MDNSNWRPLDAFRTRCQRRILGIQWTDLISNDACPLSPVSVVRHLTGFYCYMSGPLDRVSLMLGGRHLAGYYVTIAVVRCALMSECSACKLRTCSQSLSTSIVLSWNETYFFKNNCLWWKTEQETISLCILKYMLRLARGTVITLAQFSIKTRRSTLWRWSLGL